MPSFVHNEYRNYVLFINKDNLERNISILVVGISCVAVSVSLLLKPVFRILLSYKYSNSKG